MADDLEDWGWSLGPSEGINMRQWGIDHVLQSMGASDKVEDEGGDIRLVSFAHGLPKAGDDGEWISIDMQSYSVGSKLFRYTGAHYVFGLDEVNGGVWDRSYRHCFHAYSFHSYHCY